MHRAEHLAQQRPFRVGSYLVEPQAHRVIGGGGTTKVEPKQMQVLLCLAAHPGQTITRERLLDEAWPETYVGENALSRAISHLRKVFDDDPRFPQYIETIPTVGYRLIAPVVPAESGRLSGSSGDLALASPETIEFARPLAASYPHKRRVLIIGVGLMGLLLLGAGWLVGRRNPPPPAPLEKRPVTSQPGLEMFPTLSPDGKQLAYAWQRTLEDDPDIYVKMLDGEQALRLTDHPAPEVKPTWTPDGQHIAFWRRAEGDACGIFLVSLFGGPAQRLTDCGIAQQGVTFSPDGRWIAVTEREDPDAARTIVLIDVETLEKRHLTTPHAPYLSDLDPTFSPDSRSVAFSRNLAPGVGDLYVAPVSGGPTKRLTFDESFIAGIAWSADGRHLYLSSNRSGPFRLWKIAAAGGEIVWLPNVDAFDPGHLDIAADGSSLVYEEWFVERNIVRVDLAGSGKTAPPTRVVQSSQWDFDPDVDPTGERLAFVSNRSGTLEIWTSATDGTNLQRLTTLGSAYASTPRWSPSGRRIAFSARRKENAELYVVDAQGGRPQRLTNTDADEVFPYWSRDGATLYFASNRSGQWEIWVQPAADGAAIQLTEHGGYQVRVASWEGEPHLFFTRPGRAGLWVRPVRGGPTHRLIDDLALLDAAHWTLAGGRVVYLKRTAEAPILAVFDLASKTTTDRANVRLFPSSMGSPFTLSPDGRQLYFTSDDRIESDLMLVNLR